MVLMAKGVLAGINYDDPVVKYRGYKVIRLITLIQGRRPPDLNEALSTDFFYSFYLPAPVLVDDVEKGLERHYAVVKSLLESRRFSEVRSKTVLDSFTSSLAASVFASELIKAIEESTRGYHPSEGKEGQEKNIRERVERAVEATARIVDNVKALKKIAEGDQPGSSSLYELEEYSMDLLKLARNLDVSKILELIKGLKPWMLTTTEEKQNFKRGEYDGYELGRDVERVASSNLALPEELFDLRFVEGRLLLYKKVLSKGKGPVYVLLDKSGSMDGLKMTWAKAVALAIFMKASREFRDFYFRFFDSITYPLVKIERKLKARRVVKMIDYIASVRGSGGTDITRAIITATTDLRTGQTKNVSDIVLITDGIDRIAEQQVTYGLRKAGARLITVMVGGENKSLKKISYRYLRVEKFGSGDLLTVVDAIPR
ncbi:von Willebrand factor, type A [Thermogladius calderae 1633]|uniref:von Willebrand factor, type A n=2 Tax=Thermogladius calderae TaxID=1200300 RepID=I3TEJ6_THEC1|nr:von Willebrand factor, type A [Thermogladius calderae 1633]